jgi:hypothetical protein
VTRIKANGKLIANDVVCESCKEKFENDELLKCDRCGRLQTKLDFNIFNGKNICYCIRKNENLEEKELPSVPYESQSTFYERQINSSTRGKRPVSSRSSNPFRCYGNLKEDNYFVL